jgi:hypothetical protein
MKNAAWNNAAIALALVLCPVAGHAQVDLDNPFPVWVSDHVFHSAANPKVLYYFPKTLIRSSAVTLETLSDRLRAKFSVGMDMHDYFVAQTTATSRDVSLDLRVLRPLETELIPESGTDVPHQFRPELTVLGAFDLAGPTPITLEIDRRQRLIGQDGGKKLFDQIFLTNERDHIAILRYSFNAIVQGKPAIARTAVAIFAGFRRHVGNGGYRSLLDAEPELASLRIQNDRENCWNTVAPGEFCIRD